MTARKGLSTRLRQVRLSGLIGPAKRLTKEVLGQISKMEANYRHRAQAIQAFLKQTTSGSRTTGATHRKLRRWIEPKDIRYELRLRR